MGGAGGQSILKRDLVKLFTLRSMFFQVVCVQSGNAAVECCVERETEI